MDSDAPKLDVSQVTPHIAFSSEEGKVWLNEQRVILFCKLLWASSARKSTTPLGKNAASRFFCAWVIS